MPLTCECTFEYDTGYWCLAPEDYSELRTKRARRCSSCKALIAVGDCCGEWPRLRCPDPGVRMASAYTCERCTDLFFSLDELGYKCIAYWEDMTELAKEYAREHS